MTRDQQEMALWAAEYSASRLIHASGRAAEADFAVAEFRKRYPVKPAAPPAVWYDDPPFPKDGNYHPCWIQGATGVRIIYWSLPAGEWKCYDPVQGGMTPLAGRRVSPIVTPQEPPQ